MCLLLTTVTSLLVGLALQSPVPKFKDYPAPPTTIEQNAPLVLTRSDRNYRTRLREAAKEKPNFAGHYIVVIWGCGSECVVGAAIDAQTGRVFWIPHSTCCWGIVDDKFAPVEFRLDSSLIIFSGLRDEKEGDDGTHFYNFKNGRFIHIRSVPKVN
jgi:hypothetical protein